MAHANRWRSIADMPVQHPMAPATPAEARGRFFNTGNEFNVQLPPVPDRIFTAEPARALDPTMATGLIACDISAHLACRFPATTPLVLAHYARIRAGEALSTEFVASGVRETPLNDFYNKDVRIQPNGCVPHTMYLWQVKEPAQSKQKYDLFAQLAAMPTPEAFPPPGTVRLPLVPS